MRQRNSQPNRKRSGWRPTSARLLPIAVK
jgi:hypothetical protein